MNVLSTFDGMGCGLIALKELGISVGKYYVSEIDKFAIQQTKHNFKDEIIHIGSVTDVDATKLDKIDLLIGGSPCQGFSFAGKQLNFDDPRSKLFWEFVRLWEEIKSINPDAFFFLENVNMKKEYREVISDALGVQPVRINSNLVSAQNRDRWYWTNIRTKKVGLFSEVYSDIPQPKDKGILLGDILQDESEVDEKYYLSEKLIQGFLNKKSIFRERFNPNGCDVEKKCPKLTARYFKQSSTDPYIRGAAKFGRSEEAKKQRKETGTNLVVQINPSKESGGKQPYQQNRIYDTDGISPSLNATAQSPLIIPEATKDFRLRRLTPIECARLQTIPDWYEWIVSDTQQYKMLGNGWTVEVIKHIFSFIKPQKHIIKSYDV